MLAAPAQMHAASGMLAERPGNDSLLRTGELSAHPRSVGEAQTKVPSSKSAARISPVKSTSANELLCRFLVISRSKACQRMSRAARIVGQASSLPVVRASLPAVFEMATRTNSNSRLEAAPTGRQDACPYNSPLKARRNSAAGSLLIASSRSACGRYAIAEPCHDHTASLHMRPFEIIEMLIGNISLVSVETFATPDILKSNHSRAACPVMLRLKIGPKRSVGEAAFVRTNLAKPLLRPANRFGAFEDGEEIGGGESFGVLQLRFGAAAGRLHRCHLFLQNPRNPLLLRKRRERD